MRAVVPDYGSTSEELQPLSGVSEPVMVTYAPAEVASTEVKSKSRKAVLASMLSAAGLGVASLLGM